MKNLFYTILITLFSMSITSCGKQDILGQPPTDDQAPSSVTNAVVQNTSGGAIISYTLPKDVDISYVLAEYQSKGQLVSIKSSIYKNFLEIDGLGSTDPIDVKLYTVDTSNNKSLPLSVTINPLLPPVYEIANSFKWERDFGGFALNWTNVSGSEVVITVMRKDSTGTYYDENSYYTSAKNGQYSFRGFSDVPTDFALYVRDKYKNYSDTVKFTLTPMREIQIPTTNFAEVMDIPADNTTSAGKKWAFSTMWDGIITESNNGWSTSVSDDHFPVYGTIDMGIIAKLSRFIIWQRYSCAFDLFNIKKFELWGATEYEKGKDLTYWRKGGGWETDGHWQKLGAFEMVKPSSSIQGVNTEADWKAARNGFEFPVPLSIKPVRYIRIAAVTTYMPDYALCTIGEIKFFGNDHIE